MPVRSSKPQETRISELAEWLRPGRGGLPLSSGPRASSPAPAGRGAAAGVYHTPEGSPPGGLSGPGAWVLHTGRVGAGGGHWDGSMPVRLHTFDGECNGYRSGNYLHYTIAAIAQALQACYGLEASVDFQTSITEQDFAGDDV